MRSSPPSSHHRSTMQVIGVLMAVEAVSLAIASTLHLTGVVHGRSDPFDATRAGIAEAIIGAVLLSGAVIMLRAPERARTFAVVVNGFAIAGVVVGLNFTARGGHLPDVLYHVALLPVLVATLVVLVRSPKPERRNPPNDRRDRPTSPAHPEDSEDVTSRQRLPGRPEPVQADPDVTPKVNGSGRSR
jgi:peptidoglycan/LPS O-acetylase OafA/YrhL